ncbi:MAG: ATP-binding protein [Prolixibacteraceae bacterium]|nr:ATP-binding protein [Prolixibacteraceae bacterium]
MLLEKNILKVIVQQKERLMKIPEGLPRELNINLKSIHSHALIISGIRRCGKSTLMHQMIKQMGKDKSLYINFESPLLYDFSLNDFSRLDNIIEKNDIDWLFFDEIQMIDKWELYVRQKLDEGFKVVVTGSNASLLSHELGTKLTGRHISQELFPFSYKEFIKFNSLPKEPKSTVSYLYKGGFPEYLKTDDSLQLTTLYDDILIRDIVARYGIKEIKSLQNLASFLVSNVGNWFSASKIKQSLSISATSTIINWLSHLENSYLFSFVSMYSHSQKAMMVNPKKVYSIDTGLIESLSLKPTSDLGQKFENMIFNHLRRTNKEIFYFDNKNAAECDFITMSRRKPKQVIQVCYELTPENINREINGAIEAMKFFNLKTARLVTFNDKDTIIKDGHTIQVVTANDFLLENV